MGNSKMAKGKKYDFRLKQDKDLWTAEIIRRVSTKKTTVSKRQGGFACEADAQMWGEETLKMFLKTQSNKNKAQSE